MPPKPPSFVHLPPLHSWTHTFAPLLQNPKYNPDLDKMSGKGDLYNMQVLLYSIHDYFVNYNELCSTHTCIITVLNFVDRLYYYCMVMSC